MPRVCTICVHKERGAIDDALISGDSLRNIAKQFRLTAAAVNRHKSEHLPETLVKANEASEVARADDLLTRLEKLTTEARTIKNKAEKTGDYRTALSGIRELVRIVELLAKLRGELNEAPQVNVLLAPQWLEVRAVLISALAPYPEAKAAVASALLAVEDGYAVHSR